ncbi:Trk system potassium transporter TrkA [Natranaerobius trueperi]|uniref:Trk system potassium uptake protein TrkA n=1 Tax=Natranaerobius trueperi TaxID=759412 RepID=A0A226C3K0_9FIRM|nr:Trk system potassium transporter TrkA [Natranaerobius trueperi]OWZ84990.1 Trk system potassium transport protein TrkA [Natranaerobius trueperi]
MRVIIVGGGTIGVELARKLSEKDQDVVLIEKSSEKISKISRNLDIMLVQGNGASFKILEQAGISQADLLIAVTEIDEVNIIACMLAKGYDVNKTVARIRNPEYTEGTQVFSHDQLGIDIIINPELVTAQEMAKMIRTPNVQGVEYFADGKVQMVGIIVEEKSPIAHKLVKDIDFPYSSNIVAILRGKKQVIIPGGTDEILPGDEIYLIGQKGLISSLGHFTRHPKKKPQNVLIIGGGRIGYQLCNILEKNMSRKNQMNIKLVEEDEKSCEQLVEDLNKTMVLKGDGTNLKFLQEEDLKDVDVVVSATGDDKTNLLSSVMSRELGADKTIVEVIKEDYEAVLDNMQVDKAISPRTLTAAKILQLIRDDIVISMAILGNEKAEITELIVPNNAPVANKKLIEAKFPRGILIGAIVRQDQIIIPGGQDVILPGDRVIIFATSKTNKLVDKYFSKPK